MDAETIMLVAAICAGVVRVSWWPLHTLIVFKGLAVAIWVPSISSEQLAMMAGQGFALPWWLGAAVALFWGGGILAAYWTGRGLRDLAGQGVSA